MCVCVCACEERGTVIYGADLKSNSLFFLSWFVKSLVDMRRCECDHPAKDACRGDVEGEHFFKLGVSDSKKIK